MVRALQVLLLVLFSVTLAGCEAIATIFEVGVWAGVILVAVVVLLVALIASFFRRRL
jgi:hypothetical protein